MYLEKIQGPDDVKKLSMEQLNVLAGEMREALFNRLTKTGGHFGPNFGVVEMTIAMHYVFDSPKDKSVVFVTAAVPSNVGFPKANREKAGSQYIDVGIAEEQAVAMCSGIAKMAGNQSLVPTQLLSRERTTSFHRMYVSIKVRLLQF